MFDVLFLAAWLATIGSMVKLTTIAVRYHDRQHPKSLSELALAEDRALLLFRKVLFICASLFSVTIYGFIGPRLDNPLPSVVAWTVVYIGIMCVAVLPARGGTFMPHVAAAQTMGAGMLALALCFWLTVGGGFGRVELLLAFCMAILGLLTYIDRRRFIFYELAFIYLNHITIVVAALAVYGV